MIRRHAAGFRALLMAFDAAVAVTLLVGLSALRFGPDWSVPRLHEPWHRRTMWTAMGGSLSIVFGLLAGDLPVAVWLLAGGCVLMTGLFCSLAWAVLLDPRRRLAFEVQPEAVASPVEGEGE